MIIRRYEIEIYDWTIYFIELKKSDKYPVLEKLLKKLRVGEEAIETVKDEFGGFNGGHHIYSFRQKESIILLHPTKTKKDRVYSLHHEKRHVEDKILEYSNIDDSEAAGFLSGYLAKKMVDIL